MVLGGDTMTDRDFKKLLDTARKALSHMGADDHRPVSLKYEGPRAFAPMRESEQRATYGTAEVRKKSTSNGSNR
jgi:hypothetical protein